MSIKLGDNIEMTGPVPNDARYLNVNVPWTSTTEVNTSLLGGTGGVRYTGLTVNVNGTEYWYNDGIADIDLIEKSSGGGGGAGMLNWTGSTANAIGTYISVSGICAQPNLTFNGSILNVTGTVTATTVTGANVTSGSDPGHTHSIYASTTCNVSKTGTAAICQVAVWTGDGTVCGGSSLRMSSNKLCVTGSIGATTSIHATTTLYGNTGIGTGGDIYTENLKKVILDDDIDGFSYIIADQGGSLGWGGQSFVLGSAGGDFFFTNGEEEILTGICAGIVDADTCFVGSGAGLTGTAASLTAGNATSIAGLTATAAEINTVADGTAAKNAHTHDDRYYTESESNSKFLPIAAVAGLTATMVELNTVADGTTAKNSHSHDDRYYTESESNTRYVSKTVIGNNSFTPGYLTFTDGGSTNRDFIAYNDTTNSFYFNADTTHTTTAGNACVYAANVYATCFCGKAYDSDRLDGLNSSTAAGASTIAARTSACDIAARLFCSTYTTTNATIGSIMTKNTTDTYVRPSTPAQIRAGVTDGYYLGATAKASDSNLLDGLDSSCFLRASAADIKSSGALTFNDNIYASFGTGADMDIFHSGTHGYISNATGHIYIRPVGTEVGIFVGANTCTQLYNDGVPKFKTCTTGTHTTGTHCSTVCSRSPYHYSSTCACSPIVCGTTCVKGLRVCATTIGNVFIAPTGCGTAIDWVATSDCRIKKCIEPITSALSKVESLCGVCYELCLDNTKDIGLIAQEVEKVEPRLVAYNEVGDEYKKYGIEDNMLGLKYDKFAGLFVEAIKELKSEVNDLNNINKELTYRIKILEQEI